VIKELRESGVPLDDLDITIVDDDFSHFLGFTLPWVIRGCRDHDTVFIHSNTEALPGIITVVGSVQAIDPEHKTITLADNTEIRSDASLQTRNLSGAQQRAFTQALNP
jgi:sulfide:quinone oxidoreductase